MKTIHSFFSIDYIYQGFRILSTIEVTSILRQGESYSFSSREMKNYARPSTWRPGTMRKAA